MKVAYAYLLRVPALGGLVLAAFAPLALLKASPASPLLHGIFDVDAASIAVITLFACLAVASLVMATEMVLRYGCDRFQVPPLSRWSCAVIWSPLGIDLRRCSLVQIILFSACGTSLVIGLLIAGRSSFPNRIAGVTAGVIVFVALVVGVVVAWKRTQSATARFLAAIVLWTPDGYVDKRSANIRATRRSKAPELLPGHGLLAAMAAATLVVYLAFGWFKYIALTCGDGERVWYCAFAGLLTIPTLASVVVLLTLVVYVAGALTFLFDRFRIPVFVPLIAFAVFSADWPQSDNFFDVQPVPVASRMAVPPDAALAAVGSDRAIIVAASGGGIHAAAWTAAVLAHLEEENGDRFHQRIRLISAVSGGSVGAMYVVNSIAQGRFTPASAQSEAFDPASASSLDEIAWGLVYPDVFRLIVPFAVRMDRGIAAEHAWKRLAREVGQPLADWRPAVLAGQIPAVIFNATLEDTGGRLAIGTTDLADKRGVKNFRSIYGDAVDPSVVTAARLSATFSYVSPAARIGIPVPRTKAYHVVDGSYFDTYGITSAVDWLAATLPAATPVNRVLVLQIRGQVGLQDPAAKPSRGFFQQLTAPVITLLHYRDAAQIGHNNTELQLLCAAAAAAPGRIRLENAVFEYPKCSTPLSWHLTDAERSEVWEAYGHPSLVDARRHVADFLDGSSDGAESLNHPPDAATCGQFYEHERKIVDESCR